MFLRVADFAHQLNNWGKEKIPFLFITDFELENLWASPLQNIEANDLLYFVRGKTNAVSKNKKETPSLLYERFSFDAYQQAFRSVQAHLQKGNSFLVNLAFSTPVKVSHSLDAIFHAAHAPYKLYWKNKFVLFSPESFVQICNGKIFTYPMKGTISASIPDAEKKILTDEKEKAEHITIVDLLRNDLAQIASNVQVSRFRYTEKIHTKDGDLWQVSSEICGQLPSDYHASLGTLLLQLLPAGSVSGAPKPKTRAIIQASEKEKRGFYSGVFGLFDGENLDTAVMIRFIKQQGDQFYYQSGGGITAQSDARKEYEEIFQKIYVPLA